MVGVLAGYLFFEEPAVSPQFGVIDDEEGLAVFLGEGEKCFLVPGAGIAAGGPGLGRALVSRSGPMRHIVESNGLTEGATVLPEIV